jgi:hypothetical protein
MTDDILRQELFKILTKSNETQTLYGKRWDNRPYKEIIDDIIELFKKEK